MIEKYCIPWKHDERDADKAVGFADRKEYQAKLAYLNDLMQNSGSNGSLSQATEILRNACMDDELCLRVVCMQLLLSVRKAREFDK